MQVRAEASPPPARAHRDQRVRLPGLKQSYVASTWLHVRLIQAIEGGRCLVRAWQAGCLSARRLGSQAARHTHTQGRHTHTCQAGKCSLHAPHSSGSQGFGLDTIP